MVCAVAADRLLRERAPVGAVALSWPEWWLERVAELIDGERREQAEEAEVALARAFDIGWDEDEVAVRVARAVRVFPIRYRCDVAAGRVGAAVVVVEIRAERVEHISRFVAEVSDGLTVCRVCGQRREQ